jgi:hypothetical protein
MIVRFKRWLRGLSSLQAGVFYIGVAVIVALTIIHNPTKGYRGRPFEWQSRGTLSALEFLGNIDEAMVYLGVCLLVAAITWFGIWLTGIRTDHEDKDFDRDR